MRLLIATLAFFIMALPAQARSWICAIPGRGGTPRTERFAIFGDLMGVSDDGSPPRDPHSLIGARRLPNGDVAVEWRMEARKVIHEGDDGMVAVRIVDLSVELWIIDSKAGSILEASHHPDAPDNDKTRRGSCVVAD